MSKNVMSYDKFVNLFCRSSAGSVSENDCSRSDESDSDESDNDKGCGAGYYLEDEGCRLCPNGTYSFKGDLECTNCTGNSTSSAGSTSPSDCTERSDDDSYNNITCPAGTYLEAESCIFCPNNTFSFEGAVECTNCPGNSSSLEGSTSSSNCTWENDDESENKNSTSCPAGTYLETESCIICPNNTYSFLTDSDSCTDCPDNHTSAAGSTSPENCTRPQDCEAGYYYNEICMICPNNTYSFEGAVECTNCPGNSSSLEGSTSPSNCTWENDDESENKNSTSCPAGTYLETESCIICPNNTYSFLTDSDSCTDCPDNHTSAAGSTSPENCTRPQDCEAGYYYNEICMICPNNTYSFEGDIECTNCPGNSSSLEGSTSPSNCTWENDDESENKNSTSCPAGTYLETESCIICPNNTYSFLTDSDSCTDCPDNHTSAAGSTSPENCTRPQDCEAGYYYNEICMICPNNTYSFEGAVECTNCPGNSSSLEGSTSPSNCTWENDDESENKNSTTCPAGTYLEAESCIICPNNTFSFLTDSDSCTDCPDNHTSAAGSTSPENCTRPQDCEAGYYYNEICMICPNNTYSFEGAVECTNCPGNSSSLEGSTSPSNCTWENDDESENKNSTSCPAGTYLETESCIICPNNTYSFLTDSDSCTDCPDNHTSAAGSTSPENCTRPQDCEAGYYYNEICMICPNNTYSFEGDIECTNCPGNSSSLEGSTSPSNCTWENDDESENKNSTSCPAGTYLETESCIICPNNTYSFLTDSDSCTDCPDNHTSAAGSTSPENCTRPQDCEAGYYYNEICMICPNNTYSFEGAVECTNCPGNSSSLEGSTSPSNCTWENDDESENKNSTTCPAGTYLEAESCIICPNNTFSFLTDSDSCTDCPDNHTSAAGSTSPENCTRPQDCEAGYYYNEICMICPNNTYSFEGDIECTNCTGNFTSYAGSISPDSCTHPEEEFRPCEAGYYYITASNNCRYGTSILYILTNHY